MSEAVEVRINGYLVKKHPYLHCLCREDGAVFVYGNPDNHAEHWTFGSKRGKYLRVYVENHAYSVHTLINETFHENPECKDTTDHINRNPLDNRSENLRWATRKEQQANRVVNYTTELKLKTRRNTEFAQWYWETYHQFKRDDTARYQRALRFYNKHGYFPVKEQ